MKDENKVIFGYLRKSTDRVDKQVASLERQKSDIYDIARILDIEPDEIRFFEESESARYINRKVFGEMIKEIDKGKPKIILVWAMNRLARNATDGEQLENRIKWANTTTYKQKKTIIKIVCQWVNGTIRTFDENNTKSEFSQKWADGWQYSEDVSIGVTAHQSKRVSNGGWCWQPPKGLMNVGNEWEKIFQQTSDIGAIRMMFELRSEWLWYKYINEKLKNAWLWHLKTDSNGLARYLSNPRYIWEYTDKHGEIHALTFVEWEPPISRALWDSVHWKIKRKWGGYWKKKDIISQKLKSETWMSYTRDEKHEWRNIYYKPRKGKGNIAQWLLLELFTQEFTSIVLKFGERALQEIASDLSRFVNNRQLSTTWDAETNILMWDKGDRRKAVLEELGIVVGNSKQIELNEQKASIGIFLEELKRCMEHKMRDIVSAQKAQQRNIEKRIAELDTILMWYSEMRASKEITAEEFKQFTEVKKIEKWAVTKELEAIITVTGWNSFYEKVPMVLQKMFELIEDGIYKRKVQGQTLDKWDIFKLIEMTVFELIITPEKVLQIKLLKWLEELISLKLLNGAPDKNRTCV